MNWTGVPTDEVLGYLSLAALSEMSVENRAHLLATVYRERYDLTRARNAGGAWEVGFFVPPNISVLDYGCGLGVEALRMLLRGARVKVYDVQPGLAEIVAETLKYINGSFDVTAISDLNELAASPDMLYSNGVLHHLPNPEGIVEFVKAPMVVLGLYTRAAWVAGAEPLGDPPLYGDGDERCMKFGRRMDAPLDVFAEPYWKEKIEERFRQYDCEAFMELPAYKNMAAARLRRKE